MPAEAAAKRSRFRDDLALSDEEFRLLRDLIRRHTGIALNDLKRPLVRARLARHLRRLGLASYREYYNHLTQRDPLGAERLRFIDAVTTNTTSFFREPHHFDYLTRTWLPEVRARGANRPIHVWSAGCSTGEEPYSIALALFDALGPLAARDIRILATDIDTAALARARHGAYTCEQLASVPDRLLRRFFRRAGDDHGERLCVQPAIRDAIEFRRLNLLGEPWPVVARFDAIFCRNVLIYFDAAGGKRVLQRLDGALAGDGVLFLGHSESLLGASTSLGFCGRSTFRKARPEGAGR